MTPIVGEIHCGRPIVAGIIRHKSSDFNVILNAMRDKAMTRRSYEEVGNIVVLSDCDDGCWRGSCGGK
jgi:uncharacterized membrane protein